MDCLELGRHLENHPDQANDKNPLPVWDAEGHGVVHSGLHLAKVDLVLVLKFVLLRGREHKSKHKNRAAEQAAGCELHLHYLKLI